MFMGMKMAGVLRISEEVETLGMDLSKHGGSAYEYGGMERALRYPSTPILVLSLRNPDNTATCTNRAGLERIKPRPYTLFLPGGPEGLDASKHDASTSKIKPEGKYKVAPLPDEGTNRTNESNSVHSIGGSANPNVTITDSD